MKINEVYKPKNNEAKELYRNFITIYYYLLFNNKPDTYYKKILKYFYKDTGKEYFNFFYNNFYSYQNIFFFTLYNQLPLEFLPLPKHNLYYNYSLIIFTNKENFYSNDSMPIELDKNFISNKIKDINSYWKDYVIKDSGQTMSDKKLNELDTNIKENTTKELYDNFQISFNIKFIKLLPKIFLKDKLIFIFVNCPIISINYQINFEEEKIYFYSYYIKNNSDNYIESRNSIVYNFKDIKFLSFYKNINKYDIYKCFNINKMNKGNILYTHDNSKNYEYNKQFVPLYFTKSSTVRIQDPLYLEKNNKYILSKYKLTRDINILDLTTNVYLNNEIVNKNYIRDRTDLYKCYNLKDVENNLKFCDYDFINPNNKLTDINYNKKNGLLLIIWKNKKIIDYTISFTRFLKFLDIKSYFNLFSLKRLKNNNIELLGEEYYINIENVIKLIK